MDDNNDIVITIRNITKISVKKSRNKNLHIYYILSHVNVCIIFSETQAYVYIGYIIHYDTTIT